MSNFNNATTTHFLPSHSTLSPTPMLHGTDHALVIGNIIVDCIAFILCIVSLVCMWTVKNINRTIQETLVSFSFANLMGASFFVWNGIAVIQHIGVKDMSKNFLIGFCCSMLLSVVHLSCIVLAEFIIVSSHFKDFTRSFRGVLGICWFISIILCTFVIFLELQVAQTLTFVVIVLSWSSFIVFYLTVMRKYRNRRCNLNFYKSSQIRDCQEIGQEIYFPRVIVVSYYLCALPWAFKEIFYIYNNIEDEEDATSIWTLIVYSLNYYLISFVCLHLRFRNSDHNTYWCQCNAVKVSNKVLHRKKLLCLIQTFCTITK